MASNVAIWYGMCGTGESEDGSGSGSEDGRIGSQIGKWVQRKVGKVSRRSMLVVHQGQGTFSPSRNIHDELELIAAVSGYDEARLEMTCRASLNVWTFWETMNM